jgi:hypothetical protein
MPEAVGPVGTPPVLMYFLFGVTEASLHQPSAVLSHELSYIPLRALSDRRPCCRALFPCCSNESLEVSVQLTRSGMSLASLSLFIRADISYLFRPPDSQTVALPPDDNTAWTQADPAAPGTRAKGKRKVT